ncbi:MAG: hypothetical protein P4N59_10785 [Negativicutes bacterium]|nr:hypothetical protein [Negativicutes bacterium]
MAIKKDDPDGIPDQVQTNIPDLPPTIEELAAKLKTKTWVIAGVMKANKWATGKRMTEDEFTKAVAGWLKSPVSPA